MWEVVIPAAVGAATSLFNNKKNNDNNLKAIQLQFDNAVKMWNMQNEYNTPLNQSKRLKEAGLNPLLMYNNAAAGGTASAMANPVVTPNRSPLDGAVDNIAKLAQVLMSGEEIKGKKIANDNAVKTGYGIDLQNKLMEQQYGFNDRYNPLRIDDLRVTIGNKEADKIAKDLSNDFSKSANPLRLELLRNDLKTAVVALDKLTIEKRNTMIKGTLLLAQIDTQKATAENLRAKTYYTKKLTEELVSVKIPFGKSLLAVQQMEEGFRRLLYNGGKNSLMMQDYLHQMNKHKGDAKSSTSSGALDKWYQDMFFGDGEFSNDGSVGLLGRTFYKGVYSLGRTLGGSIFRFGK